ncbi:pathogenesis-related homeodomain protein isoform X2 [Cynara cardunculus var. scolymus]|uniref:pathogenesis-related homeodomain protein isoform X2 n=1 Tax=Cynara cardunculus var. scolymus TaxID=59895 RepID=UPI000D62C199|nr:pathogenesis-related homeodomain protein isoform X2 [Cynara cardunculus var. scolymus]
MTGAETKEAPENIGKLVHLQSSTPKSYAKRSRKLKPHGNTLSSPMSKKKLVDLLTNSKKKEFKRRNASNKASKSLSKPSLVSCQNQKKQLAATGSNENEKCEKGDPTSEKFKQRRKRKRTNNKVEVDEASRLQRRTRYLLIKMKIEQNLLDAYSTEGWKGQSREKIKPEKELQRAKKQILKCKLGIRDALRQLDLLSSDGCIDESVIAPDGSVHHEHEIFKVEATLPDGGNTLLNQEEWPSDDSGDDDYDPDRVEKRDSSCSRVCSEGESCDDDASSSYSLQSLDVKALDDESQKLDMGLESISADLIGAVSGSGSDCEFVSGRRQRQAVDYRKLYDEMFGKDALANEQASEDEDWGPTNRKRREKESDAASTLMTLCETEEKSVKDVPDTSKVDTNLSCKETKRSFFRIPSEAVEKLRLVFAKNELPSRAVKEDLSKQLGLDLEKVNKWFKNARYLSLKTKRAGEENPTQNDGISISKESGSEPAKNEAIDEILSEDMPTTLAHTPGNGHMKKFRRRKNPQSPTSTAKQQQVEREFNLTTSTNKVDGNEDLGDDDLSLKMLRENVKKEKIRAVDIGGSSEGDDQQAVAAAESQMEKLCFLKTKMEKLKQVLLLRTPNRRAKTTATSIDHTNTIFVPVAHLKEKH